MKSYCVILMLVSLFTAAALAQPIPDTLWTRIYGGSAGDWAYCVQQTADGGYVLAGWTNSFGAGSQDFYLVKTGPDQSGTDVASGGVPAQYALYPNYPNPFNPSTQIVYDLVKAGHVSLQVFDLLGREVAVLAEEMQPAGTHFVSFDGSNFSSGIYFYRLQAGDFVQTRKMALLK